jgi:pilus assembly protein Flp/PilA
MLYHLLRTFARRPESDEGATAVEYALLVGLITVVVITGVTLLGGDIDATFTEIAGEIGA